MISSKSISLALAALVLVVLTGASTAFAQTVTFNVSTAPTFVANTGRAEVMGQVTMTADATCGTNADGFCVSTAGTIQVLYQGTPIDNNIASAGIGTLTTNGIEVCETIGGATTCNAAGTYITPAFTVNNTTSGGVVSFGVLGAIDFAAGDQVVIRGARGQIDLGPGNVVGTSISAQLTASPSTIAGFQPTSEVVARSADPLTMAFGAWTILQCLPNVGTGTVTITEGFNTAFVDHDGEGTVESFPAPATLFPRPTFAPSGIGGAPRALRNSRINIVLTGLPPGVTINWPLGGPGTIDDSGTGVVGSTLNWISESNSGDNVTYTFSTPNQAASDINGERFVITVTAAAHVILSQTPADFGSSTGQGQMWDPHTGTSQPRYNHPLEPVPGAPWLTVAPCTTNLLFPWVINVNPGLDTGLAIANTSMDPYGTAPQTGTCTLTLYPTNLTTTEGVNAGAGIPLTTDPVEPGSVWRAAMSGTTQYAGFAGYIIAVCNFQYGHGFGYITDNFGVGAPNTAQGYLALLIPDPVILGARSAAKGGTDLVCNGFNSAGDTCVLAPPYGEGLTQ